MTTFDTALAGYEWRKEREYDASYGDDEAYETWCEQVGLDPAGDFWADFDDAMEEAKEMAAEMAAERRAEDRAWEAEREGF